MSDIEKTDEKYCWNGYCFEYEDEAIEFREWAIRHTINANYFAIGITITFLLIVLLGIYL